MNDAPLLLALVFSVVVASVAGIGVLALATWFGIRWVLPAQRTACRDASQKAAHGWQRALVADGLLVGSRDACTYMRACRYLAKLRKDVVARDRAEKERRIRRLRQFFLRLEAAKRLAQQRWK